MPEGVGYGPQNTVSSGKDIHVIGNHAYAYSGAVQAATSDVTQLDFMSGNYYLVGTISVMGMMKIDAVSGGGVGVAEIQFNGQEYFNLKVETGQEDMPAEIAMPIIIPPYTQVTVLLRSEYDTAGSTTSVNILGRIYK